MNLFWKNKMQKSQIFFALLEFLFFQKLTKLTKDKYFLFKVKGLNDNGYFLTNQFD
jgi:hypothetical protein